MSIRRLLARSLQRNSGQDLNKSMSPEKYISIRDRSSWQDYKLPRKVLLAFFCKRSLYGVPVQDLYKRYPQELRASSTTTGPFCSSFIEETLSIYVNLPFRSEIDSSKFCKQGRHGQFTIFLKRQNVPWQISTKWAFVSYRVVAWVWCTQMIMPFKIKRTKPAKK